MRCYDCSIQGDRNEAIGVCHHCSVGLCVEHGALVSDPILVHEPIAKVVALPKKARELLCRTCLDALRQRQALEEQVPAEQLAHR
jgi:hypothetical protein